MGDDKDSRVKINIGEEVEVAKRKPSQLDRKVSGRLGKGTSKEGILRKKTSKMKSLGSVIQLGRAAAAGDAVSKVPRYMNTYKLESDKPFDIERVEGIVKQVLIEALENLTYDPEQCANKAKLASNAIRTKVKEHEFDRYKLVCVVTIGEKRYHDMCSVVKFLWDFERDKYAIFVHDNMHVFGTALCFGIYYE